MANEIKIKTAGAVVPSLDDMKKRLAKSSGKKLGLGETSAIGKRMMSQAQALLHGNNAVLLVDCSGSMSSIMREAREGANQFITEALKKRYHVGVVGFQNTSWIQAEIQKDGQELGRQIRKLEEGGTTDMTGAFRLAREMLQGQEAKSGIIYMVTDGYPDDHDTTEEEVEKVKACGYEIMCLGIGPAADKDFLKKLATRENLVEMCEEKDTKTAIGSMAGRLPALAAPKKKKG